MENRRDSQDFQKLRNLVSNQPNFNLADEIIKTPPKNTTKRRDPSSAERTEVEEQFDAIRMSLFNIPKFRKSLAQDQPGSTSSNASKEKQRHYTTVDKHCTEVVTEERRLINSAIQTGRSLIAFSQADKCTMTDCYQLTYMEASREIHMKDIQPVISNMLKPSGDNSIQETFSMFGIKLPNVMNSNLRSSEIQKEEGKHTNQIIRPHDKSPIKTLHSDTTNFKITSQLDRNSNCERNSKHVRQNYSNELLQNSFPLVDLTDEIHMFTSVTPNKKPSIITNVMDMEINEEIKEPSCLLNFSSTGKYPHEEINLNKQVVRKQSEIKGSLIKHLNSDMMPDESSKDSRTKDFKPAVHDVVKPFNNDLDKVQQAFALLGKVPGLMKDKLTTSKILKDVIDQAFQINNSHENSPVNTQLSNKTEHQSMSQVDNTTKCERKTDHVKQALLKNSSSTLMNGNVEKRLLRSVSPNKGPFGIRNSNFMKKVDEDAKGQSCLVDLSPIEETSHEAYNLNKPIENKKSEIERLTNNTSYANMMHRKSSKQFHTRNIKHIGNDNFDHSDQELNKVQQAFEMLGIKVPNLKKENTKTSKFQKELIDHTFKTDQSYERAPKERMHSDKSDYLSMIRVDKTSKHRSKTGHFRKTSSIILKKSRPNVDFDSTEEKNLLKLRGPNKRPSVISNNYMDSVDENCKGKSYLTNSNVKLQRKKQKKKTVGKDSNHDTANHVKYVVIPSVKKFHGLHRKSSTIKDSDSDEYPCSKYSEILETSDVDEGNIDTVNETKSIANDSDRTSAIDVSLQYEYENDPKCTQYANNNKPSIQPTQYNVDTKNPHEDESTVASVHRVLPQQRFINMCPTNETKPIISPRKTKSNLRSFQYEQKMKKMNFSDVHEPEIHFMPPPTIKDPRNYYASRTQLECTPQDKVLTKKDSSCEYEKTSKIKSTPYDPYDERHIPRKHSELLGSNAMNNCIPIEDKCEINVPYINKTKPNGLPYQSQITLRNDQYVDKNQSKCNAYDMSQEHKQLDRNKNRSHAQLSTFQNVSTKHEDKNKPKVSPFDIAALMMRPGCSPPSKGDNRTPYADGKRHQISPGDMAALLMSSPPNNNNTPHEAKFRQQNTPSEDISKPKIPFSHQNKPINRPEIIPSPDKPKNSSHENTTKPTFAADTKLKRTSYTEEQEIMHGIKQYYSDMVTTTTDDNSKPKPSATLPTLLEIYSKSPKQFGPAHDSYAAARSLQSPTPSLLSSTNTEDFVDALEA